MATRAPKLLVQLQWFFALLWLKFDDIQIQSRESDRNDYPTYSLWCRSHHVHTGLLQSAGEAGASLDHWAPRHGHGACGGSRGLGSGPPAARQTVIAVPHIEPDGCRAAVSQVLSATGSKKKRSERYQWRPCSWPSMVATRDTRTPPTTTW